MNNQMGNMNNYNYNNSNNQNKDEARRKLIVSILGLAIVIIAIIGISFAAYRAIIVTKGDNKISTGDVSVSFTESNNYISLNNAMPVSDDYGISMKDNSFDFVVTTSSSSSVSYDISVTSDDNNTLDDSYVKVYLLKDGNVVLNPSLFSSLPIYSNREDSKVLYRTEDIFKNNENKKSTHYTLKMWIDKNYEVSSDNSKTFKLKVNVDSAQLR